MIVTIYNVDVYLNGYMQFYNVQQLSHDHYDLLITDFTATDG